MDISYLTNTRGGLNVGACHQALGVVEALGRISGRLGEKVTLHEYDVSEVPALASALQKNTDHHSHIVIGVGDDGVEAFRQLPQNSACTSVLIGHEVPKNVESVSGKIDILAIPEHVTDLPNLEGVRCIRTSGVSHIMTPEKADEAFAQWKNKLPMAPGQPAIVVMLGGSVDGKHFDPQEVQRLGDYVAHKAKALGAYVLVTHSPRAKPEALVAFNTLLREKSCQSAFFGFAGDREDVQYQALLGAVRANSKSMVITTGDSVSMPCEAGSIVNPDQLAIVHVGHENPQNRNFVEWMNRHGHAGVVEFTGTGIIEKPAAVVAAPTPLNAAQRIAHAVKTYIASHIDRILGRPLKHSHTETLDAPGQIAQLVAAKAAQNEWGQRIDEATRDMQQGGQPGKAM